MVAKNKFIGFSSGDLGDHLIGPLLPSHVSLKMVPRVNRNAAELHLVGKIKLIIFLFLLIITTTNISSVKQCPSFVSSKNKNQLKP